MPWIVIGIAALIVIGAIVIIPALKDDSPPRPVGKPPRIPKVNLTIQSNVGGADVYLNGQQKGITSDTHHEAMLFNLAPKTYQITLKKSGYAEATKTVEVTGYTISQAERIDLQPTE